MGEFVCGCSRDMPIDLGALAYMALNITSAVSIVFLNKWLFEFLEFPFPITIVFLHFIMTTVGLTISLLFGQFKFKRIPLAPILPLDIAFCGFVVLTNMSLQYNSVGFYQICKVMTTPCVMILEATFFDKKPTTATVVSLLIVCCGVLLATVSDVSATLLGSLIAMSSILCTSLYQIWVGTYQKKYEVNSPQLLFYQAPTSAVLLLFVGPTVENAKNVIAFEPTAEFWVVLTLSCFAAFFVNLSTFLLLGRTSTLTYNAVGHAKMAIIILGGYLLFAQTATPNTLFGVGITFVGLILYTKEKLRVQTAEKDTLPTKVEPEEKPIETVEVETKKGAS